MGSESHKAPCIQRVLAPFRRAETCVAAQVQQPLPAATMDPMRASAMMSVAAPKIAPPHAIQARNHAATMRTRTCRQISTTWYSAVLTYDRSRDKPHIFA